MRAQVPARRERHHNPYRGGTFILNTMVLPYYNERTGAHLCHTATHGYWREDAARPPVEGDHVVSAPKWPTGSPAERVAGTGDEAFVRAIFMIGAYGPSRSGEDHLG